MCGENIRNKESLRSATVKEYVKEINTLHILRGLEPPIRIGDKNDPVYRLIYNLEREEDVAKRRKPITNQMAARLIKRGLDKDFLSKEALTKDVTVINREMGCRAAELVQTSSKRPDYHVYPSGKKVVKSICRDWFKFYGKNDKYYSDPVKFRKMIMSFMIRWAIQKNRRNGEECWFERNMVNVNLCLCEAIINMIERAHILGQPDNLPLCVYRGRNGEMKYLTRNDLSEQVRIAAKEAHPELKKQDLSYYSCHSFRVWAAVLLSEQGKNGDYIKIRLRWLSEAYRVYLRNTKKSGKIHNETLEGNATEINFQLQNLPGAVNYVTDEDESMGEYTDIDGEF